MKNLKMLLSICLVFLMTFLFMNGIVFAQDVDFKSEGPVLITSCGQSPGPIAIKYLLKKAKVDYKVVEMATPADLKKKHKSGKEFKTLVITMGASMKGMGAAGIEIEDEINRTKELIAEARKLKIKIIGAHVGGMGRRSQGAAEGDNTDELSIDTVAPNSDLLLLWADGNSDGRFTKISKEFKIPMVEREKKTALSEPLKKIFSK